MCGCIVCLLQAPNHQATTKTSRALQSNVEDTTATSSPLPVPTPAPAFNDNASDDTDDDDDHHDRRSHRWSWGWGIVTVVVIVIVVRCIIRRRRAHRDIIERLYRLEMTMLGHSDLREQVERGRERCCGCRRGPRLDWSAAAVPAPVHPNGGLYHGNPLTAVAPQRIVEYQAPSAASVFVGQSVNYGGQHQAAP